jgi:hypothetical protein
MKNKTIEQERCLTNGQVRSNVTYTLKSDLFSVKNAWLLLLSDHAAPYTCGSMSSLATPISLAPCPSHSWSEKTKSTQFVDPCYYLDAFDDT